jgi:hypothetical protein
MNKDLILEIYQDKGTVYRFNDIAMMAGETNSNSLGKKLNKFVHLGKLLNPRKGIYAKSNFNPEELACILNTPSYISLEYVLQKAGVVFQYDSRITTVSYLSRDIEIDTQIYSYRKIKSEILIELRGILRKDNGVNIATPERAFLDLLYLEKDYYFDNLNPLNKELIYKLLPVYNSNTLNDRVKKLFKNGQYKQA